MFKVLSWQTCLGTTASEICTRRLGAHSVQFENQGIFSAGRLGGEGFSPSGLTVSFFARKRPS
jgi:hypothetical protein